MNVNNMFQKSGYAQTIQTQLKSFVKDTKTTNKIDTTVKETIEDKDTIEISQAAKDMIEANKAEIQRAEELLNSSKAETEQEEDMMDKMAKCLKIAKRMLAGHKVPAKDQKFLAKENPKLYQCAITFKQENSQPKKYKALTKDEESRVDSSSSVSGAPAGNVAETAETPEVAETTETTE